ncbi:hypothetical protein SHI21_04610 [Bacteriovorax sp. PP10]|uniref:Uncharacterized protein n=1 Tax=Bacteriovorax antarcticus TaxID=3088717 RepID=A0ABU5VQZ2_9BACT|nr:hypothetical protein [Bacteriovorax sp. PP10]MEA9355465.1 hypothetical protein [Bacteriovorax sp. PP10]
MKYAFIILALSVFTQVAHTAELNEYLRAGQVKMSAKDCEELGVKVSIVAFSSDYNPSFMMLDLNNKKAVDFFDTTRKQIHEKITAYCKDDKSLKTIDDFQEQFHASCAPACDDNLEKIYKDSVWGASKEKKNADITCMSLCNQTSRGLELLKTGARYAGKQSSAAADCNGVVANKGRNIDVKTFSIEDNKNQRIKNATDAER